MKYPLYFCKSRQLFNTYLALQRKKGKVRDECYNVSDPTLSTLITKPCLAATTAKIVTLFSVID